MTDTFTPVMPVRSSRTTLGWAGVLKVVALGAVLAALWTAIAPVGIGGSSSYVVTQGASMLPDYEAGGLVITRKQDEYQVGDVVAYHNRDLADAVVMHRIIGTDGDRFVLRGDNNDFADTYRPALSDVVGREWVYWPHGGRYLAWLRDPVTFALIIAGITLVSLRVPRRSRRRRRHHSS